MDAGDGEFWDKFTVNSSMEDFTTILKVRSTYFNLWYEKSNVEAK